MLDVIVEPIDRHAELLGVEAEQPFLAEEFVDQRAQLRDGGVGRLQGDRTRAGAACGEPRHADGDQDEKTAQRQPIAFARQTVLVAKLSA